MSSEYKSFYHLELFKWLLFPLMGITFTRGVWALKVVDFNICNRKLHIFYIIQCSIWRQRIELGVWIWKKWQFYFWSGKRVRRKVIGTFFLQNSFVLNPLLKFVAENWIGCSNSGKKLGSKKKWHIFIIIIIIILWSIRCSICGTELNWMLEFWNKSAHSSSSSSSSSSCGQSDAQFVGENWIGCLNLGQTIAPTCSSSSSSSIGD